MTCTDVGVIKKRSSGNEIAYQDNIFGSKIQKAVRQALLAERMPFADVSSYVRNYTRNKNIIFQVFLRFCVSISILWRQYHFFNNEFSYARDFGSACSNYAE
ncbi:hypothetical protein CHS0354_040506 [Potamilus streckersoni]|uniref:Uncharacterized protein n=1 Tax=Potamilus streckersoni TaxID=2493646 RepID=A0AAE0WF60_9BIVA|nr:hypothetical protein CHS0354_040506 [Potamilus streckersoni]